MVLRIILLIIVIYLLYRTVRNWIAKAERASFQDRARHHFNGWQGGQRDPHQNEKDVTTEGRIIEKD